MSYSTLRTQYTKELDHKIAVLRYALRKMISGKATKKQIRAKEAEIKVLVVERNRVMMIQRWKRLAKHVQFRHKTPERYAAYLANKIARRRAWKQVEA